MIAFPEVKVGDHLQRASGFDIKTYVVTRVLAMEVEVETPDKKVRKIPFADSFLWRKVKRERGR